MGGYLKLFENDAQYLAYKDSGNMILPNVSHCIAEKHVHYNPWTWAEAYLTTVALEEGTISFNIWATMGTDMIQSISYSTDNGKTWTTTTNQDNKETNLEIVVNVNAGDTILWKGDATQTGYYDEEDASDYTGSFFSSTCEFDAKGNVMSLLYGDNFKGQSTISEVGGLCCLFYDYYGEKACSIVNAKDLILPATTLVDGCYRYMFYGCTSLTSAPELPATALTQDCYSEMFHDCTSLTSAPELPATALDNYCYSGMFQGCTSLTSAPNLPATTLTEYCYYQMFQGCTSLTSAPNLPATTLTEYCYTYMFTGCTSLVSAPELPATTLASGCYQSMFNGCTSLTTAPELPATTLANACYHMMFYGCTSLTTAPELPATTLANDCYQGMFQGCTSLTTAPDLPATTLASGCYQNMFNGCTSLNYIKAMFTTTPSTSYTSNWVQGVASTGTFVKNAAATWDVTGQDGIPTGWTVETASA